MKYILIILLFLFLLLFAYKSVGAEGVEYVAIRKPIAIKQLPKYLSVEEIIREEAKKASLSQIEIEKFLAIAMCESKMNPAAYNIGNYGLFQINKTVWNKYIDGDLYDARYNSWFAFNIVYKKSNINAWSCARLI